MILPGFTVHSSGVFEHAGKRYRQISAQVGGRVSKHQYDHAYACISGEKTLYHGNASIKVSAAEENVDYVRRAGWLRWAKFAPHTQLGSFVTHSYVVFRPFMQRMLAEWTAVLAHPQPATLNRPPLGRVIKDVGHLGAAPWMEVGIACINPDRPHLGFGESSNYMTFALSNYPEAYDVQPRRSWGRNPDKADWSQIKTPDGFCCNVESTLNRHWRMGEQFMGIELGHSYAGVKHGCGYTSAQYFTKSAYPPDGHEYWTSRGISFAHP